MYLDIVLEIMIFMRQWVPSKRDSWRKHWWHNNMSRQFTIWATCKNCCLIINVTKVCQISYIHTSQFAKNEKIVHKKFRRHLSFEKFQKLLILCGKKYLRVWLLFIGSNPLRILNKASRLFPCEISRWFLLLP